MPDGGFAVVWVTSHALGQAHEQRFGPAGQPLTEMLLFGDEAVVWSSGPNAVRDLEFAIVDLDGGVIRGESGVAGSPSGSDAQLAWSGDGLVVAYRVVSTLFMTTLDGAGETIGGVRRVSRDDADRIGQQFSVAWSGVDAVIAWVEVFPDRNDVLVSRLRPACVALPGCAFDDDCPLGARCDAGACIASGCVSDDDCAPGAICLSEACVP